MQRRESLFSWLSSAMEIHGTGSLSGGVLPWKIMTLMSTGVWEMKLLCGSREILPLYIITQDAKKTILFKILSVSVLRLTEDLVSDSHSIRVEVDRRLFLTQIQLPLKDPFTITSFPALFSFFYFFRRWFAWWANGCENSIHSRRLFFLLLRLEIQFVTPRTFSRCRNEGTRINNGIN